MLGVDSISDYRLLEHGLQSGLICSCKISLQRLKQEDWRHAMSHREIGT